MTASHTCLDTCKINIRLEKDTFHILRRDLALLDSVAASHTLGDTFLCDCVKLQVYAIASGLGLACNP